MQTTIQLHINELDEQVIESLKQMFDGKEVEITVKTIGESPKKEGKPGSKKKRRGTGEWGEWKFSSDQSTKEKEEKEEDPKSKFEEKMKEKMKKFEDKMEDSDFDFKDLEDLGQKAFNKFLERMEKYKR